MTVTHNSAAPVLALTIVQASSLGPNAEITLHSSMLLAVRDAQTNVSHPDVISVPTQRIPRTTFDALRNIGSVSRIFDSSTSIIERNSFSNYSHSGHNELIFSVNSLLATKLGVSEALERKLLKYSVYLRAAATGTVFHPSYSEPTLMLNAVVIIEDGYEHFPKQTPSYSHLVWCPVTTFLETAITKNPLLLDPAFTPIQYCIHGMCIKSAFNVIADSLHLEPYPYDPYSQT